MDFNDKNAVFAKVAEHLLKQNDVAVEWQDEYRMCRYQDAHGLRCAVGCLIPDEHPALQLNGDIWKLLDHYPDLFGPLSKEMLSLLNNLQSIHDSLTPSEWPKALRSIATRFGITLPECLKDNSGNA